VARDVATAESAGARTTATAVAHTDAALEGGFLLTRLEDAARWSRKNSLWPLPLGLACCAIEFMATAASRYDMARFGMEVARFSPRQADLLFVAGWLTYKMAHVMTRLYDQMSEPKWVVAMGACASTGGMHRAYPVVQGIDEFVPVDVYIPGCPPRPEAVLNALIHLQEKVARDRGARVAGRPTADTPMAGGGVAAVVGRGEMTPPVLFTPSEAWVAGAKPRVGADDLREWGPNALVKEHAPPHVAPIDVAVVDRFGGWWAPAFADGVPASRDDWVAVLPRAVWADAVAALAREGGYDLLLDLTAVDYPDRDPRFTVVAVLLRTGNAQRLVVETRAAEGEAVPTLSTVFPAANWAEREAYDMFGIAFDGHPDLTRILLPNDFEGWPLRRDFPLEGHLRFRD
jgi:NADH-quinone oxidoreductase B subunit/NADH/F420H2 dehydrogenase subunit C